MHQTLGTDTGPRWELCARVASSILFAAAIVGLFLPWDRSEPRAFVAVPVVAVPVVGLALSLRKTRRASFARTILAAAGTAWFGFPIALAYGFTGRPPDWMAGWVTFWALVGAFVTNLLAARPGSVRAWWERRSG